MAEDEQTHSPPNRTVDDEGPPTDGSGTSDTPADAAAEEAAVDTDDGPAADDSEPGEDTSSSEGDDDQAAAASGSGEFDAGAAEARLKEVEEQIEEGRRALADIEQEPDAGSDGPPVAAGEGAANAPPG